MFLYLVFLWHKGRNFRAITGDCRLAAPINFTRGISAAGNWTLLDSFSFPSVSFSCRCHACDHILRLSLSLRWLNTVLAVCECMSFAKSLQEKGCSSQAETWQVKNILMKDCDWQVKFDVFVVSMATWTIEYNLKISLLFSLHKIRSLDFPIILHTAYCN